MSQDKNNVLLLFQKPLEPIFTEKDNGKTAFDVPADFLADRYKSLETELQTRFGDDVEKRVPLQPIAHPDLTFTNFISRRGGFSLFNPRHKKIAGSLIKIFMDQPDVSSFVSTAAYVKDRVNPYLFQYALTVATQHRADTENLNLPSVVQTFPDQFIDSSVFPKAREEGALFDQQNRSFIDIPLNYTANERETEQRMAYFREDIGVNMHHWHWHLVYPGEGEDRIVNKDRRGELFYYMHSQIIARYNVERFCNRLGRVRPLTNLNESIPEAYFPKIIRSSNNRAYPPRFSDITLKDINRPEDEVIVQISDLERWRDRIFQAIDEGSVVNASGQRIPLDEFRGIDILGNIVEACNLSPNQQLYGNLHNQGHNIISYSHDPENRYLEEYGVMGDVTTAMRDPIFYRWHSFIDSVFVRHKDRLTSYDVSRHLAFDGISVNSIGVQITRGKPMPNVLLTYWQRADVDLAAGLDFGPRGNVYAQFTHLQHAPFEYQIMVNNNSETIRRGTCRIFLCPQTDERGTPLLLRDLRHLMIEMDKFTVNLNPGMNNVRRRSDQSSVTIPYERSFRRIGSQFQPADANALAQFQFCGCGWPQHMLIPKGTPEGTRFNIFVMISNYADDSVNQNVDQTVACNDAASYCGLRDRLYPDRRNMGYPFDRLMSVDTLNEFANQSSNMGIGECIIRFTNTIIARS